MDVFCKMISQEDTRDGISLLIETHSETMVSRVGELITQGKLDSKLVKILLFNKDDGKTKITETGFDEDGYLIGL